MTHLHRDDREDLETDSTGGVSGRLIENFEKSSRRRIDNSVVIVHDEKEHHQDHKGRARSYAYRINHRFWHVFMRLRDLFHHLSNVSLVSGELEEFWRSRKCPTHVRQRVDSDQSETTLLAVKGERRRSVFCIRYSESLRNTHL